MAHGTTHTWFIDTKGDPRTNRLVGLHLDEENECRGQLCEDRESRDLWRCPSREFVTNFQRTADVNKYPYDIYVREGNHGLIRLWPFDKLKKYRRTRCHKIPLKYILAEAAALASA
jgi:hypothetical protein